MIRTFWAGLTRAARWRVAIGAFAIVAGTGALALWVFGTEYEVLFADLSTRDAASMTHELEQMKRPYRLSPDGRSILVDKNLVHQTRLDLMGKDRPLYGAVGFELFNNVDFGMTEFAQKVNYQRALQGEITRTVQSIDAIESARVHLAFPEEGLFKRDPSRTKASVALVLREGRALRREQVVGIQRLVAAAVPGVRVDDVTIVDAKGVALTPETGESESGIAASRLELKREVEQELVRKADALLEKAFGVGQAMASVDVTLDMNAVKVTTENVVAPPSATGSSPTGVIVRERQVLRDAGTASGLADPAAASTHREIDYQLGRRVEQVVSSPGAVSRLSALAVVRSPLTDAQAEQLRQLLASAVGASRERGDTVVVQSVDRLVAGVRQPPQSTMPATHREVPEASERIIPNDSIEPASPPAARIVPAAFVAPTAAVVIACLAVAVAMRRRRAIPADRALRLSDDQRRASLERIRLWLERPNEPSVDAS